MKSWALGLCFLPCRGDQAIKKQNPGIHIIALTSFQEDELVSNAMEAGAVG
jgi:DNA-binding NarL/FixJ family response regulator